MRKKIVRALAAPTTAAAGAGSDVSDLVSAVAVLAGSFDATYQLQMSLDGTNYVDTGSALVDAAGSVSIPDAAQKVRWNCTEHTSGTPVSSVGGVKDPSAIW